MMEVGELDSERHLPISSLPPRSGSERSCYAASLWIGGNMKKIVPVTIALVAATVIAALALAACSSSDSTAPAPAAPSASYEQISAQQAKDLMDTDDSLVILDVRTQQEYEQSHIPGAICVPNETIGSEEIPALPHREQLILVYCRSGNRSKQAAEKLVSLGYTNVVEFGGINSWPGETVSGAS